MQVGGTSIGGAFWLARTSWAKGPWALLYDHQQPQPILHICIISHQWPGAVSNIHISNTSLFQPYSHNLYIPPAFQSRRLDYANTLCDTFPCLLQNSLAHNSRHHQHGWSPCPNDGDNAHCKYSRTLLHPCPSVGLIHWNETYLHSNVSSVLTPVHPKISSNLFFLRYQEYRVRLQTSLLNHLYYHNNLQVSGPTLLNSCLP